MATDRPEGCPVLVQPVVVERPTTISWMEDIRDFINTVAYSD